MPENWNGNTTGAKSLRLKVLISAYACNPEKGSEPGVGWNLAFQVSKFHEVWLFTRAKNRPQIEAALAQESPAGLHFVYLDLPAWAGFWKKGQRGIHLYYYLWQIGAYFKARNLDLEVGFDLVHHLTFGIDWMPSFLALLPRPFIWGPIVGAESTGRAFRRAFPWAAKAQELIRLCVRGLSRFDPLTRFTARRSAVALASSSEAKKRLTRLGCPKVLIYPSVGISSAEMGRLASLQPGNDCAKVRFLTMGRLLAFRGFPLLLQAFCEARRSFPQIELWIIGDGPERGCLVHQAERLGIGDAVKFWGWLPRSGMLSRLPDCSAFVHLCFRGAISMACAEAMAAGLPVICLDLGGLAVQVTQETGIKVPAVSPAQVVRDSAAAMKRLAGDPALRLRMGNAARQRVFENFGWAEKAAVIAELYRSTRNGGTFPKAHDEFSCRLVHDREISRKTGT